MNIIEIISLIIILAVFIIVLLASLFFKIEEKIEDRKRAKQARILWNNKKYNEFIDFVKDKQELLRSIGSEKFLNSYENIGIELYIKGLFKFDLFSNSLLKPSNSKSAICSIEAVNILYNIEIKNIIADKDNDTFLIYFVLYRVLNRDELSKLVRILSDYVKRKNIKIYDEVINSQWKKFESLANSINTEKSEEFSNAEKELFGIEGKLYRGDFLKSSATAHGQHDEVTLNGHNLKFYQKSHEYFIDGIRVLSVTQMLKEIDFLYGNYAGVSKEVLNRAAEKGTALHAEIQNYEEQGEKGNSQEFLNYLKLKEKYSFSVLACERYVIIYYNGIPISAGRFDLLLKTSQDTVALADIKRTSTFKKDDVTKQLNLYTFGFWQTYGYKLGEAYCIRLRENVAQFAQIDIKDAEVQSMINNYVTRLQTYSNEYWKFLCKIHSK